MTRMSKHPSLFQRQDSQDAQRGKAPFPRVFAPLLDIPGLNVYKTNNTYYSIYIDAIGSPSWAGGPGDRVPER